MFNLSCGMEVVDFIQIRSKHKTKNTLGILYTSAPNNYFFCTIIASADRSTGPFIPLSFEDDYF